MLKIRQEPERKITLFVYRTKHLRMDQKNFFKGCLPQILLGPFLNNLSHI